MDAQYSPPPWRVAGYRGNRKYGIFSGGRKMPLAFIEGDPLGSNENRANARLVSTAPELLAELKGEHNSEFMGSKGCTLGESCRTCALIAKAEGQECSRCGTSQDHPVSNSCPYVS